MVAKKVRLTKSKFLTGLQCRKKLFLKHFHIDLESPYSPTEQTIINEGLKIQALARKRFQDACLIRSVDLDKALLATSLALDNDDIKEIFEPSFIFENIQIRADIVIKNPDGFIDLIEIKSSSKIKDEYYFDLGIQYYVIENNGYKINKACIMHLNPDYIYPGDHYNLDELFVVKDLTQEIKNIQPQVLSFANEFKELLISGINPDISPGKHCKKPFVCHFIGYCIKDQDHPLTELPCASDNLLNMLSDSGFSDITEIPSDFDGLSLMQKRVRDVIVRGDPFFDPAIKDELAKLIFPLHFMDFETFNPALPVYAGTKPYQIIPFQWSDHSLDSNGNVNHKEFLHLSKSDPHKEFLTSLISVLSDGGSILVYSSFEVARLKSLSEDFPEFQTVLNDIISRIIDLRILIKKYCYFPEFQGSFSLKKVLPAIIPELGYTDLDITDGVTASKVYSQIFDKNKPSTDLKNRLLEYCQRDTQALLELYKYFMSL